MVMQANTGGSGSLAQIFNAHAPGEGRTKTIGISLPPSIAKKLRRVGNRGKSISDKLLSVIDAEKLNALLAEDDAHQGTT
jgi:hypothetical protein